VGETKNAASNIKGVIKELEDMQKVFQNELSPLRKKYFAIQAIKTLTHGMGWMCIWFGIIGIMATLLYFKPEWEWPMLLFDSFTIVIGRNQLLDFLLVVVVIGGILLIFAKLFYFNFSLYIKELEDKISIIDIIIYKSFNERLERRFKTIGLLENKLAKVKNIEEKESLLNEIKVVISQYEQLSKKKRQHIVEREEFERKNGYRIFLMKKKKMDGITIK